ncbi:phenylalanine--tRNA ligase subunit beta [Clostridium botulinum]|uniref:Phenylalanine--tRNA ligase beta subunit n=1 Tax=Clostridium botulinum TaxID=1491 RepID=A0A6B4JJE8_CLOBO|nr:phenylalanine--tRNA ligase subunit beta [Clostridium botulinum]EES49786.1 phenylalanyl-tRNA synthetase, beta subunit [Clostridium botulinum E1 str. 'BoNT E Beluga']MBY6760399.1 phenylalanine--tRNA ligase subunit beta [Clostridium botulinum]MBY6919306.1 phenylalanine--tRNA ligase subunit beta [Clostridium botulinum]MCR1130184.1 phenylalanine--tRNA ligase subunit beta [Clostridium botulinum]NFH69153.1 phenylalanine--tRNA ligase subunit beta [Clostridium botulinum]
MKVPFSWLQDYVDINVSPKELGDKLTLTGSQLEELIIQGDVIDKVVTGKITEIEKHPDADKLSICQVDIGTETIQIVTAATNMKEQDVVPVALHGSTLADGSKIKKGKLRGVPSNGMFCSEEELGIAGDEPVHGLMILPTDTKLGVELKELLKLNKAILDFEITSNRPDCLSIVGMARETAAALRTTYKMPNLEYKVSGNGNVESELNVEVKDDLCLRYMARKVKNVKVKPSPGWMQERLLEAGIRPIDNIVDITNFVMLELGQPMHAYDAREISTNKIVVERAESGEKFTTLDEVERELDDSMLCIKDDNKIVGLAGIMGGLNSEIKEDTTEVIFESANFDGTNIRVNSKKLNLRSEASGRFEKDIDPNLAKLAIDRACALICELGAGEVVEGTIDIYNKKKEEGKVVVDSNWVNKFLGTDLSKEEMKKCLDSVDLFTEIDGDNLNVTAPTFRIDIAIKEDIAEEIARIHGYDVIPATIFSVATSREPKYRKRLLDDKVVMLATGSGLNQSISYSFVSPKVFDKINVPEDSELRNVVRIKNPLGEDYSVMRTTTIPSMMECLGRNYSRNNDYVRLFEMAKIYIKNEDETKIPTERNILTIGMYGDCDYLDLKGAVENIVEGLGIKNSKYERESENVSYHPGKTAKLVIGKNVVGTLGEVHLDVTENYGIDVPCFIAELNLDALYESADMDRKYKALPKFPAVTRDIALLVEDSILVQEIEECIRKAGGNLVEKIELFDIYKGKQIPDGKKSIAYAICYRADKTLTDKEVNKVHDKILRSLEYKLGATLRD